MYPCLRFIGIRTIFNDQTVEFPTIREISGSLLRISITYFEYFRPNQITQLRLII